MVAHINGVPAFANAIEGKAAIQSAIVNKLIRFILHLLSLHKLAMSTFIFQLLPGF
jgi:hypothetical protein